MYNFFIVVVPLIEKDAIIEMNLFQSYVYEDSKKTSIGSITYNENNIYVFLFDEKAQNYQSHNYKLTNIVNKNKNLKFVNFKFDEKFNASLVLDKDNIIEGLKRKLESTINAKDLIELDLIYAKAERDEAIKIFKKDTVLSAAIEELKVLRGKKKILEAAQKVAEEFKDKPIESESVKNLLKEINQFGVK